MHTTPRGRPDQNGSLLHIYNQDRWCYWKWRCAWRSEQQLKRPGSILLTLKYISVHLHLFLLRFSPPKSLSCVIFSLNTVNSCRSFREKNPETLCLLAERVYSETAAAIMWPDLWSRKAPSQECFLLIDTLRISCMRPALMRSGFEVNLTPQRRSSSPSSSSASSNTQIFFL